MSHKQRRRAARGSKTPPSKETPSKKQKRDCSKCGDILGSVSITCSWCQLEVCQPCSKLEEYIIVAFDQGHLPGLDWKCPACIVTTASIQNIDKKLDAMNKNSTERLTSIEKTLEGMEERISANIKAQLPNLIKKEVDGMGEKLKKEIKSEVKKAEEKLGKNMTDNINKMDKKIDQTNEAIVKRDELETMMKEMIQKEFEERKPENETPGTSEMNESPGTRMRRTVASVTAEVREKVKREKRLVIYNLGEQDTNERKERESLDKDKIMEIAQNTLGIKNMKREEITMADRLGEKNEERPRPLLLELKDTARKNLIMNKANKLKGSEHEYISIKYDMTKLEREQYKKMVIESRKLEEEAGGKWRYRVRGPPWDLKILKKRNPEAPEAPGTSVATDAAMEVNQIEPEVRE